MATVFAYEQTQQETANTDTDTDTTATFVPPAQQPKQRRRYHGPLAPTSTFFPNVYEGTTAEGKTIWRYQLPYLRAWRKAGHLSLAELAEDTSLPIRLLRRIERGEDVLVSVYTVDRIAQVLGIENSQLMSDEPPEACFARQRHELEDYEDPYATKGKVVPTTRLQIIERTDADGLPELALYLPRLWGHLVGYCSTDGTNRESGNDLCPEVKRLLLALPRLDVEALMQIVFCVEPAPLPIAGRIARCLGVSLLSIAPF